MVATSARLQGEQEAAWADYQQGGLSFQEGWARQRGLLDRCEQEARRQLRGLMDLLERRQKDEKLAPAAKREAEKTATSAPKKTSAATPKQESAAASSGPQQTWSAGILSSFLQQRHGQEREGDKEKEDVMEKENVKEKEDVKEKDHDSIWRDDGKLQCPECRMRLVSHGRVLRDHIGEEYRYKDSQ